MSSRDKAAPRPPRLPKAFSAAPATLEDEAQWDEVEAGGAVEAPRLLRDVVFRHSRLVGVSLNGVVIEQLRCENTAFVRCDLSGAVWDRASLDRVVFSNCRMTGLTLSGSRLTDVRFEDCGAELVNVRMAKAQRLAVESSMLRAADFQEATLATCQLEDSDLRGASFQKAQLADVSLRGSKLDDIVGASFLRGARVTPDQAIVVGRLLLAEAGIEIEG